MSSTEKLLQATLNRLGARISKKLFQSAMELSVIAQEAPEKLRKEWEIFQEEVIAEASQLDNQSDYEGESNSQYQDQDQSYEIKQPQQKIDQIRAKVAELSRKLEATK